MIITSLDFLPQLVILHRYIPKHLSTVLFEAALSPVFPRLKNCLKKMNNTAFSFFMKIVIKLIRKLICDFSKFYLSIVSLLQNYDLLSLIGFSQTLKSPDKQVINTPVCFYLPPRLYGKQPKPWEWPELL